MEIFIAVVLAGVGVWLLWKGNLLWPSLLSRASQLEEERVPPSPDEVEVRGPVGVDGLVFLFAHDFVSPSRPGQQASAAGATARAPLTGEALDTQDWAYRLLYTVLAEQYQQGAVDFRVTERAPTLMGPFPYKAWELEVKRLRSLSASTLSDCLNVAFDMLHKSQRVKQASQAADVDEQEPSWFSLDEVVEWVMKTVRTEMSFWQRQGVCPDLCRYVQESLLADGYLLERARPTWLERVRARRLYPNQSAIETLRPQMESLKRRLREFRDRCGSARSREMADDRAAPVRETVDAELMDPERALDDLPLEDSLRASVHEVLASLRDLEPKRGGM